MSSNKVIIDLEVKGKEALKSVDTDLKNIKATGGGAGKSVGLISKGFGKLKGVASKTLASIKTGIASTGIGLIPIAIGAIVVAFGKLYSSVEGNMDKIKKAIAPFIGAFESIKGIAQDLSTNVFSQLGDRWTLLVGGISNGIDKLKLKWAEFRGNEEDVATLTKDIADRTQKMNDAQESLNKKSADFNKILEGSKDRMKEAGDAQVKVVELGVKIRKAEIGINKARSQAKLDLQAQLEISKDINSTVEDKKKAVAEAAKISQALADKEIGIIDMKIAKMKLEQSMNDTIDAQRKELADLEATRIDAQIAANATNLKFISARNSIEKEEEARKQEIADKEEEDRIAKEERLAQEEADKEQKLKDANALKKKYSDEANANEIAAAKKLAEDKLKVETLSNELKLNALDNAGDAAIAILGKESAAAKAIAIAQLAISKIQAVGEITAKTGIANTAALVYGPLISPGIITANNIVSGISIASTIAAGVASAAQIAGIKFANGGIVGGSSYTGDKIAANVNSGEMVLNQAQQAQLFKQANGSSNSNLSATEIANIVIQSIKGIEVSVSESAITSMQKEVALRESAFTY